MSEECVDIRDLRDGGFLWLDKEALNLASRETGNTGIVIYSWLCYYANSKAQDCFPSVTTLSKRSHISRRTVIRHLKKLEELGLISVQRIKGKPNIYRLLDVEKPTYKTGDRYVTSDTVDTGVVSAVSLPVVTPGTLEQELIKQELSNKNIKDGLTKENKIRFLDYVMLTESQHRKLVEALGEARANDCIENLNNYIGSKGDRYKSHYHTILNWIKMDKNRGEGHAPGGRQKRPVPRAAAGDSQAQQLDKIGTEIY